MKFQPKDIEIVGKAFAKLLDRLRVDREEFLDQVASWWARRVRAHRRSQPIPNAKASTAKIAEWERDAQKRLDLYHDIENDAMAHVSRASGFPDEEFERFRSKVFRLRSMQLNAGRSAPHPSLWALYGYALIRNRRLDEAELVLAETVKMLDDESDVVVMRDRVEVLGDRARCAYLSGKDMVAREHAASALDTAHRIAADKEEAEFLKWDSVPWREAFVSAKSLALFVMCDTLIHRSDWESSGSCRRDFNYYWHESAARFRTPESWTPPFKIKIVTDEPWLQRVGTLTTKVAEQLFVEMADDAWAQRWLRWARVKWWGVLRAVPRIAPANAGKAAALALALALMSDPAAAANKNILRMGPRRVAQQIPSIANAPEIERAAGLASASRLRDVMVKDVRGMRVKDAFIEELESIPGIEAETLSDLYQFAPHRIISPRDVRGM